MTLTLTLIAACFAVIAVQLHRIARHIRRLNDEQNSLVRTLAETRADLRKLRDDHELTVSDWVEAFKNVEQSWDDHITKVRDEVATKVLLSRANNTRKYR